MEIKNLKWPLAFLPFFCAQAENMAPGPSPTPEKYTMEARQSQVDKLMEIGFVKALYQQCAAGASISDCVWNKLSDAQKKEVQEKLTSGQGDSKKKYEGVDIGTVKGEKDPGLVKLQEYFRQKLRESLYGEIASDAGTKGLTVVNHKIFYDLYETQISKNIIESISSYCLDAGSNLVIKEENIKTQREENLKLLKNFHPPQGPSAQNNKGGSSSKEDKLKGEQGLENDALTHFTHCTVALQHICHETQDKKSPSINFATPPCSDEKDAVCRKKDWEYSKLRACEVVNYIKAGRQNLLALAQVRSDLEKSGDGKDVQFQMNNVNVNEGQIEDRRVEDMTTLTSKELVDSSGYKTANEQAKKKLEEKCQGTTDDPECKKYLLTDKETKNMKEAKAEYEIRSLAIGDRVNKLKDNEDELKKYLKEQGYNDAEIKEQLTDKEAITKSIERHYSKEKEKIIESLKKRFGKADSGPEKVAEDQNKIDKIKKEIGDKPEKMAQLAHFNNIVFGLLSFEETGAKGKKKQKTNTQSLYKEIENSYFDPKKSGGKAPASASSLGADHIQAIKEKGEESGLKKTSNSDSNNTKLTTETINSSILDYDKK